MTDLSTLLAELDAHWNAVGPLHLEATDEGVDIADAGLRCLAEVPDRLGVTPQERDGIVALVNAYPALREGIEQAIKTQQHMDETLRPLVEELRKAAHQARARETEACAEAARLRTERDEQAAIASNAVTKGAAYALGNERLRTLVEQQREALRDVASCDESGQLCWCDGHYSTREDESGQCVRYACAKARVVLAEEVPGA